MEFFSHCKQHICVWEKVLVSELLNPTCGIALVLFSLLVISNIAAGQKPAVHTSQKSK
jgi:hypothetical protein